MLDYRSPALIAAAPAGLALGLVLWLAFGSADLGEHVDRNQHRLAAITPAQQSFAGRGMQIGDAIARPLFALTTGPDAVTEAVLRLDGISISRKRAAALLSINGKPPQWIEAGQTVDDVTLEDIRPAKVTVETPLGPREVKLGGTSSTQSNPAATPGASGASEIPPGYRSPPPPASAPAMGG